MTNEQDKNLEAGLDGVQARMDEEQAKGVQGELVDPSPNKYYTVAGVTADGSGQPPRPDLAAQVDQTPVEAPLSTRPEVTLPEQLADPNA